VRVVSWNMGANSVRSNLRDAAWHHLLDRSPGLDADVALVQEAILPGWLSESHRSHWVRAWPNHTNPWGTGIITRTDQTLTEMRRGEVDGGRFVVARLATERGDVVVVSIHAQTSLSEFIPPLRATFEAIGEECTGSPFIVGGDLNTARSAETFWPEHGHAEFWEAIEGAGFHSSFYDEHGHEAITYRHPKGPFVGQADHIFIDAGTANQARVSSWVDETETNLSDHRPLVVDLEW
jgi:endonuclease/exonuclease/phosphatase family metal-dependent hydrolase